VTEESKPSAEQLKPPSYYRDPRPTLTDEEREAIAYYIGTGGPDRVDAALRDLLERLN